MKRGVLRAGPAVLDDVARHDGRGPADVPGLGTTGRILFLAAGICDMTSFVAGCVSSKDEGPPAALAAPSGNDCVSLVDARRNAARRIDDIEAGRGGGSTLAGLYTIAAVMGAGTYGSSVLTDSAAKENQRALDELRASRTRLDREIEEKQCTLDAKAKAGALKATEDARYDGTYAGKGTTDSWCVPPTANLRIEAGRVSGSVRDWATSYQVKGQAFEDGSLSLLFKRASARSFTDEFQGKLDGDVVSFFAPLDASRKGCTYRFALKRG